MRILILSDLHHEAWRDAPRQAKELLATTQPDLAVSQPDVVVLAGDIDVADRAVAWADQTFPSLPVIYVHGNHEAYGQKLDTLKGRIAEACSATGHIHFLDKRELVIGNVRFLGATLWTDFQLLSPEGPQEAMQAAAAGMNDYRKIRLASAGYRKIRPLDVAQWHWEDRTWLEARLAKPFSGSTVVVTHMGPSAQSIPGRYKDQLLSAAYASNLDSLVVKSDLWVHGHIHDSMDYTLGNARVVCNPLGYPLRNDDGRWFIENGRFDPNLVVDLCPVTPAQRVLLDAAAHREVLAARWPSAAQVGERLSSQPDGTGQFASQLRRAGQLLGVYIADPVPSYRYPTWQFRPDGRPVDCLADLLTVLRNRGAIPREPDGLRRTTGWSEVEWFLSPHALLDGAQPAEILAIDPARVLRAALVEFGKEV
ncbi:metallophosphoesterase [Stenotrophomonas sp. Ste96]|uniref:metallophosphoesterase n=1 Tax=Stenotrophomonas sp. Ste96 TaxID=2926029 RepID=UPI0021C996A1|nr:metallophosphoesterase [Stenotrophomonas sp. Ste96]